MRKAVAVALPALPLGEGRTDRGLSTFPLRWLLLASELGLVLLLLLSDRLPPTLTRGLQLFLSF